MQYKFWIFWIAIVALAFVLRTFQLGTVPVGLTVDEAAIGYNGFAILTQHRDEWLVKMPLTFKSFGEYKPPLAIYSVAVTTFLFGPTTFAIRFPMAVAGVVTAIATYAIARKILNSQSAAFIAMLLVAVSPHNIHFSRIAFESSLGIATVAVGAAFFVWATEYVGKKQWLWFGLAALSWAAALYSNHATKLVLPLVIVILILQIRKTLKTNYLKVISVCFVLALSIIPLVLDALRGVGNDRLMMTSVLFESGKLKPLATLIPLLLQNFFSHFNLSFLLFGAVDNYRHGNGVYGIFSFVEAALVLVGIISLLLSKKVRQNYLWLLALCGVALLPSIISTPVPHANRIHHIVPWIQIIATLGLMHVLKYVAEEKKVFAQKIIVACILVQLVWQLPQYYRVFTTEAGREFQSGFQEVVAYTTQYDGVDEIYFTDSYDQAYIYVLLFRKIEPIAYHHGVLNKFKFAPIKWDQLKDKKNILVIAGPGEVPPNVDATHTVSFPTGETAFKVIKL